MKYKVMWSQDASQDLAELWVSSRQQITITAAANALDQALSENPFAIGESRGGERRVSFHFPLGIVFEISESQKTVFVTRVWQY